MVQELFENEHVQLLFLFKVSLFGTWLVLRNSGLVNKNVNPQFHEAAVFTLAWAAAHAGVGKEDLVELALEALDRVEGAASELAELWSAEEAAGAGASAREWHSEVEDLRNRLAG